MRLQAMRVQNDAAKLEAPVSFRGTHGSGTWDSPAARCTVERSATRSSIGLRTGRAQIRGAGLPSIRLWPDTLSSVSGPPDAQIGLTDVPGATKLHYGGRPVPMTGLDTCPSVGGQSSGQVVGIREIRNVIAGLQGGPHPAYSTMTCSRMHPDG